MDRLTPKEIEVLTAIPADLEECGLEQWRQRKNMTEKEVSRRISYLEPDGTGARYE